MAIIDEMKIRLGLEDKATPQLKKSADEISKKVKEIEGPFQKIVNLKNMLIAGVLMGLATFIIQSADAFVKLGRSIEQASFSFRGIDKDVRDLSFSIREMGKESIFSTEQLTQALDQVTMAGLDSAQALDILRAANLFAAATGIELSESMDSLQKIMQVFNIDATESGDILAKIANISKETGVSADFLLSAMASLGSIAAAGNVSFNDLLSTMIALESVLKNPAATMALMRTALEGISGNIDAIATLKTIAPELVIDPGKTTIADVIDQIVDSWAALAPEEKAKRLDAISLILSQKKEWALLNAIKEIAGIDLAEWTEGVKRVREEMEKPVRPMAPTPLAPSEFIGKQFEEMQRAFGEWVSKMFIASPLERQAMMGMGAMAPLRGLAEGAGKETPLGKFAELYDKHTKQIDDSIKDQIKQWQKGTEEHKKFLKEDKEYWDKEFVRLKEKAEKDKEITDKLLLQKEFETRATEEIAKNATLISKELIDAAFAIKRAREEIASQRANVDRNLRENYRSKSR